MSRPMLLAFLLIVLIITSQFEWKQQLVPDVNSTPSLSQKQQQVSKREETVKEKIILLQEKHIQRLRAAVQHLEEQLYLCRGYNETKNGTASPLSNHFAELEQQLLMN